MSDVELWYDYSGGKNYANAGYWMNTSRERDKTPTFSSFFLNNRISTLFPQHRRWKLRYLVKIFKCHSNISLLSDQKKKNFPQKGNRWEICLDLNLPILKTKITVVEQWMHIYT